MDRITAVEELILNSVHNELYPDEQDIILFKAYRMVHSMNKSAPCYDSHADWRAEFDQTDHEND